MFDTNKLNNILDFDLFVSEKMGVLEREIYQEYDEFQVSEIINDFMYNIRKRPNDKYETIKVLFGTPVRIVYKPSVNPDINAASGNKIIYIYKRVSQDNYIDIKYTFTHELVHIIHQILSHNERPYDELSDIEKIRYKLIKNTDIHENSRYLNLMTYLIDRNEVYSRNQNAYILSFKYKKEHPNSSNQEIIKSVLNEIRMSKQFFSLAIKELEEDEDVFIYVIGFLLGNFFEFGKGGFQQYFDKSIFQIPVVKKMRNEIKQMVYNKFNLDGVCRDIKKLIKSHEQELEDNRDKIISSFVEHMEYWFNNAQKRLGKAIQLGIDDATEYFI